MNALVLVCPAQRIGPSDDLSLIQVTKNASGQIDSISTVEETFGQDHLPTIEEVELAKSKKYTIIMIEPETIPLKRHSLETKERITQLETMGVKVLTNFSALETELAEFDKVKIVYYPNPETSVFYCLFNMNMGYSDKYQFYPISTNLSKIISSKKSIPYFNLFEPSVLSEQTVEDLTEYYEHYVVMLDALSAYLDSGFLTGQVSGIFNQLSWQLNLSVPELNMFVRHFSLYPTVPDQREMYREQFMCNAQYRQVVTETLAKLMANIIKLNGWSRKIKDSSDWEKSTVYKTVAQKLRTALQNAT